MNTNSIPRSVDAVDAPWLTDMLRGAGHRVTVTRCSHVAVIGGNATKVRLRAEYVVDAGASTDLPAELCVKVGMELQDASKNLTGSTYDVEGCFYLDVAPRLPALPVPRCVAVRIDPSSHRCALVMEDLIAAGATFGNPLTTELTVEQTESLVQELARVHAQWWQHRAAMPLRHLEHGISLDNRLGRYYSTFDEAHIQRLLDGSRGSALPRELHDAPGLVAAFWAYADVTLSDPVCVIHADPHLANIYIRPDGSCGIADWQTLRWGPWAHDIAYLVVSSLSIEDWRTAQPRLLEAYREALANEGVDPPSADEANTALAQALIYGTFGWLTAPAYFGYPEELSNRYVSKFGTAALRCGTFDVLGVQ